MIPNTALLNQGLLNQGSSGAFLVELLDTVNIADTTLAEHVFVLLETIYLSDNSIGNAILQATVTDTVQFLDDLLIAFSIVMSETINISDSIVDNIVKLANVLETLQFLDVISSNHNATVLAAESIGIYDALLKYFERSASETINFDDVLLDSLLAAHLITDTITIADDITPTLTLFSTAPETINITDALSSSAVLQLLLNEGFSFETTFEHDGVTYTGWVMNSENFAVTTYNNYQFNSLCKFNGKYYGAKSDGVYLLEGDRDGATDYINSIIRTGRMDLGTSNLKNISQCYLGFTGNGKVVLKVVTDNDIEAWYNLTSSDTGIHTDRITLAKGPVGRYWQFELVTQQNTELELDSVELFPIVLKRKI